MLTIILLFWKSTSIFSDFAIVICGGFCYTHHIVFVRKTGGFTMDENMMNQTPENERENPVNTSSEPVFPDPVYNDPVAKAAQPSQEASKESVFPDPVYQDPVKEQPKDADPVFPKQAQPEVHTQQQQAYTSDAFQTAQPTNGGAGQTGSGGFAIASLVLGIVSVVLFCASINIVTAILAIVFGAIHMVKGYQERRGMAIAGLILGIVSIVLYIIVLAVGFSAMGNMFDYGMYY